MIKVLIVDDNDKNVMLLKLFCRKWGYQTLEARSGREALIKAEEEKPDIILMDVLLPDLNGVEVAKILKNSEGTKNIPVIILPALDESDINEHIADALFTKPFDFSELKQKIEELSLRKTG